jgi:hypothetical protein
MTTRKVPFTGTGDSTADIKVDPVAGEDIQVVKLDLGGTNLSVPIVAGQQLAAGSVPVVLTAAQVTTLTPPAAITGYATSAKQDTAQTSLTSIDGKTPALGQALAAASVPVILPSATITTLTPPAAITGFATSAKQDTLQTSVDAINTKTPALGQALAAASVPVILPSATITTLTPPAAITGFALEAGHAATIDTSTAATAAVAGTTAGAKVVTDANGTLQQYLRGIVTFLANALGAGTAAAANRVTLASDDPAVATLGATTGAAVITDANGTIQQYLRGIVKLLITSGTIILGAGANLIGYVGFKSTYAGKVALTTTNFDTLANGSGWQSVGIAFSGARDAHFWLKTQSTGTAYVDFYLASKLSNGTGYTDAATGTEGTFTAANRLNSRYLGSVRVNNGAGSGFFALSDIFGSAIPANGALIAINNAGAAITTGTTTFEYELVN